MEKIESIDRAALISVKKILVEAFENTENYSIWTNERQPCFVLREDLPEGEILGCIFFIRKEDEIYVHSLARKASAVRLGITEQFTTHLKKILADEKNVTCQVDKDNTLAIRLYLNIGFRFTTRTETSASMIYNPTAPINRFKDAIIE